METYIQIDNVKPELQAEFLAKFGTKDEYTCDCTGRCVPYIPAKIDCLPEDSYPAEGGYVEDLEVFIGKECINDYLTEDKLSYIEDDMMNE